MDTKIRDLYIAHIKNKISMANLYKNLMIYENYKFCNLEKVSNVLDFLYKIIVKQSDSK